MPWPHPNQYKSTYHPNHMENGKSDSTFTGRLGFILAAAGSAVGLGNIWRFPYLAEEYGGGIFLLVYLILVVTFGFALMLTEVSLGRRTGKSCIAAFGELSQKHRAIGWIAALVPALILPYYGVIGGWVTKYSVDYIAGSGSVVAGAGFFESFIECGLTGLMGNPMVWFIVFAVITLLVVAFGVQNGIERVSKVLLPLLLVMLIAITVYSFTIPGVVDGLKFYLYPDFSNFSMSTVLGAMGQLFFSMSLAMGIMITYGAYMKKDVPIEKSVRNISIIDTSVAFLAGLLIVPMVIVLGGGSMNSGPGLMFETLPLVFETMPGGHVIAAVFFILVFFAALTSSISIAEAVILALKDRFNLDRMKAIAVVAVITLVLGTLSCLGYGPLDSITIIGKPFLDFFDFFVNYIMMPLVAVMTCLFIGFVVKPKVIIDEVKLSGDFAWEKPYVILVKWVCPVCLILILMTGLLDLFGVFTL